MEQRTVTTASGWPETTRDCKPDEIWRVGELLAGIRDAVADGVVQSGEGFYWASKANWGIEYGMTRVYIVNGGAPAGAAIAVPDQMNPGKALLLACNSMWGAAAEAALLEDCKAWAASRGLQLGRRVEVRRVEWQPIV